jgi:hypothetical protein
MGGSNSRTTDFMGAKMKPWVQDGETELVHFKCGGKEHIIEYHWGHCTKCGHVGFRRGGSKVVYTWDCCTEVLE